MKVLRVLPKQIPQVWEQIKFAASNADRVPHRDLPLYLNRLLHALLSDKAQCFLRMSDERELLALAITRLTIDEVTGEKALFVNCLYSFQHVEMDQWKADMDRIVEFAREAGCKKISMYSTNERVYDIVQGIGFTERFRCFGREV